MAAAGQRLILAFDYGTRRIGVAVGNELLRSARELPPPDGAGWNPRLECRVTATQRVAAGSVSGGAAAKYGR